MNLPGGLRALRESFRSRDYRLYVVGSLSHSIGVWILRTAIGWLTWELTESTAWLGAIAMAETAPTLVLSMIAGTVMDRVDYFKMMRICQALALGLAMIFGGLTLAGLMDIWLFLFLVFIRGCILAFNRPSRMSLVYVLVGRELLAPALAVNSIIFNMSRFMGPALAGGIIVWGSSGWAFMAAAALISVYTVTLAMMKVSTTPEPREPRSILAETLDGIRYIWSHRGIRLQLALLVVIGMAAKPVTDLLPGFAGQIFDLGASGLAYLLSSHGVGATVAAFWLASRSSGIQGMTKLSIFSILFLGVTLMGFVAVDVFWLACVFSGLMGFAFIVQNVSNQTLIQSAVAPGLRGRVLGIYSLVSQGMPSLGALLMGGVAEYLGLRLPVFIGGVICLGVWFAAWQRRAMLRRSLEGEPKV